MPQIRVPAVFMRGGTSKALIFRQGDLPEDRTEWASIFLATLGSPDPNGRQLDGMGGGISSLSNVCIVAPSFRVDADVDYTFAQVSVKQATVDYSGNCGNMTSAIGPFAVDEGVVPRPTGPEAVVRIHNTNTGKIIVSCFPMDGDYAAVDGDLAIDGVAGTGAAIRLDFIDPAGAKTGKLLPTGRAVDVLDVLGVGCVPASLIDAANPCVFVPASAVGRRGTESPDMLEGDTLLLGHLENIRRTASVAMGIAPDLQAAGQIPSLPKVAMVAEPTEMRTLSGAVVAREDTDILVRMISIGQPHRAVPLTGALCVAVACRIPGSVPNQMVKTGCEGDLRIGHASGVVLVAAEVREINGQLEVPYATVYRTARRLFQGEVFYRRGRRQPDLPASL